MNDKKTTNLPEKHLSIKPLSRRDLHRDAKERVNLISEEFIEGFDFLENYPKSVTFFGGARFDENNEYYKKARSLGQRISKELKYTVVSGGGPGIMEAANRGAKETGGESIGLTIELPEEQALNPYITKNLDFYYFFSRKVCLSFSAEAYIFFPGGFGTMDEFFEILTLVQTHKIHPVPIILVGSDFWNAIEKTIKDEMLARHAVDEGDLALYKITDDEDEILNIIANAPVRNGEPFNGTEIKNERKNKLSDKKCVPCEGGTKPYEKNQSEEMLHEVNQWILIEDKQIEKTIIFENFEKAVQFTNRVALIANIEGHHPDINIFDYNKVKITLTTHAIKGLSENDFIMASKIDEILR